MRTIAVTNQKGGVGKTTTAVNLVACLAHRGKRLLLIDLDPQGNATMGSGVNKLDLKHSVVDVLLGEAEPVEAIQSTELGYDILPSNGDLTAAEVKLLAMPARERVLKQTLDKIEGKYDYVIIDCPPALNMLTLNALAGAQGVLIPMQCEYYALEGLSALLNTMERIRRAVNPALRIDGILRTMFDGRNNLAVDVSEQLAEHFGKSLFKAIIPRNVRLAEAPSHGQPVLQYDKSSAGALAYMALADEILARDGRKRAKGKP